MGGRSHSRSIGGWGLKGKYVCIFANRQIKKNRKKGSKTERQKDRKT